MSAFPNVLTQLTQDTFVSNYVLEVFMKTAENLNVIKCVQKYWALYVKV